MSIFSTAKESDETANFGYGNAITVLSNIGEHYFTLTYAHLSEVGSELVKQFQDTSTGKPMVDKDEAPWNIRQHG